MTHREPFPIPDEWTPDEIMKLRKRNRLSQQALALRLGSKHRGVVTRWETGKRKPSYENQRKLDEMADS